MLATHEMPPQTPLSEPAPQTMRDLFSVGWKGYQEHFKQLSLFWITVLVPLTVAGHVFFNYALAGSEALNSVREAFLTVVITIGLGLMTHSLAWKEGTGTYPGFMKTLRFTAERFTGVFIIHMVAVLGIVLGLLVLIVPGLILLCALALVPYIAYGEDAGFDSITASWERTRGHRVETLKFVLACYLGMALFGVMAAMFVMLPLQEFLGVPADDPVFMYWFELGVSLAAVHLIFITQIALWKASQAWKSGATWAPAFARAVPAMPTPDLTTPPVPPPPPVLPVQVVETPKRPRRPSTTPKPRATKVAKKSVLKKKPKTSKPSPKKKRA